MKAQGEMKAQWNACTIKHSKHKQIACYKKWGRSIKHTNGKGQQNMHSAFLQWTNNKQTAVLCYLHSKINRNIQFCTRNLSFEMQSITGSYSTAQVNSFVTMHSTEFDTGMSQCKTAQPRVRRHTNTAQTQLRIKASHNNDLKSTGNRN